MAGTMHNQYEAVCYICRESVPPQRGLLDGKYPNGRTRVRHVGCLPDAKSAEADARSDTPFAPSSPDYEALADPFGKRAAPKAPENIPAVADYLKESERAAEDLEASMDDMLANVAAYVADELDKRMDESVPLIVASEMDKHRKLEVTVGKAAPVVVDKAHALLPTILNAVMAGASPMLVGPAGSGKTTAAEQIAKALSLPFYMAARVTSEFKLVGYTTAVGAVVRTQFREAFEHGGVFLFDEIDASDPDALTAFNAALANGLGDFPDGMVRRHKDFYALAAANTFGRGADRQYVGRNQLDAATLDRFVVFEMNYDEELELAIAGNDEWTRYVQSIRAAVDKEKVRHIVSPRASIMGAKMLAQGMARSVVEDATIWKGLDQPTRMRVTLARAPSGAGKFDPDRRPDMGGK